MCPGVQAEMRPGVQSVVADRDSIAGPGRPQSFLLNSHMSLPELLARATTNAVTVDRASPAGVSRREELLACGLEMHGMQPGVQDIAAVTRPLLGSGLTASW